MNTLKTTAGVNINAEIFQNHLRALVNRFFKILPMRENSGDHIEESLTTYMRSFQAELLGCKGLICEIQNDESYLTLIAILQFLIDNPDTTVRTVRREVFKAISLCNKLIAQYVSEV